MIINNITKKTLFYILILSIFILSIYSKCENKCISEFSNYKQDINWGKHCKFACKNGHLTYHMKKYN